MLQVHEIELSRLSPWEDNPRLNDRAVDSVVRSIRTFGFNVPILCDQNLTIIAGHTRWKAARQMGLEAVPVIVLKMSDSERRAFSLADNKTAEIADWDFSKLRELLEELNSRDFDLSDVGFSDAELVALLADQEEPDWTEFDQRLTKIADNGYVLLPVKVHPEAKGPLKAAIRKRANQIGIRHEDHAILAGEVIQRLLEAET